MLLTARLFAVFAASIGRLVVFAIVQERLLRTPRPRYHWIFGLLAGIACGPWIVIILALANPPSSDSAFATVFMAMFASPFYAAAWLTVAIAMELLTRSPRARLWAYRMLLLIMLVPPTLLAWRVISSTPHVLELGVTSSEPIYWAGVVTSPDGVTQVNPEIRYVTFHVGCPGQWICT